MYVLLGKYSGGGGAWEEIDNASTGEEIGYLLHEYQIAYGKGWQFSIMEKP